jgi:cell division protein FtsN
MPKHSKAKQYKYESESEDEDLEGGFITALLSGLARLGTTAARVAPTAARTGTQVIGKTVPSASRFISTPLRTATRLGSRFAMPALNVAGVGLSIGLPISQALDYEKQKALYAEENQRIANEIALAQSNAYFEAQDKETQKYYADVEAERLKYAKEADELAAMREREQADYARYIEEQNARSAMEAEDYQRAVDQQQRYLEEQIREEVQRLSQMYRSATPAPAPAPAPSRPTTTTTAPAPAPSRPTAPAPAPAPARVPVTTAPAPAKVGLQRRGTVKGQGVKVDKRKVRAEIVKRVMKEKGFKKLAEASKYVKEHNLYKG